MLASILTLHLAHVPYWFVGIMGWHYVLETAPLWLLLCGAAVEDLWSLSSRRLFTSLRLWSGGLLVLAVLVNSMTVQLSADRDGGWRLWTARLDRRAAEVRFPRERYAAVRDAVEASRQGGPAVVLVIPDPADRSMDYVTNDPALAEPILWPRVPVDERSPADLARLAALFPGRRPLLFDAAAVRLTPLNDVPPPSVESSP